MKQALLQSLLVLAAVTASAGAGAQASSGEPAYPAKPIRIPAGVCYRDPDLLALARDGFAEGAAVARALGVKLPDDIVEWQVRIHQNFPADMYASMYHDLVRGRHLELESLSGLIAKTGRELGVPTPFHAMAYACLKPYINGEPSHHPSPIPFSGGAHARSPDG